jgi:hypothetical protein
MSNASDANLWEMRRLCDEINASIARGEVPADVMGDFKRTIDEARLRLWASIEAATSGDPIWAQEFWLQRAADMCQTASLMLEHGGVDRQSVRAAELAAAAERLAIALRPIPPTQAPPT